MADSASSPAPATRSGALTEYAREFNSRLAQHKAEYGETDSSALLFRLGKETFALPTAAVREVISAPQIHSIPNVRNSSIRGVANFRGELLLCVSLSTLLSLRRPDQPEPSGKLMVLSWQSAHLGCIADEMLEVCRFRKENLLPPPSGMDVLDGLVLGILDTNGKVVSVLSADAIFSSLHRTARATENKRESSKTS